MTNSAIKEFNTTGPCVQSKHYMLPVLPRVPGVDDMINGEYYFTIHAPRQSGKTTYLQFLTKRINLEGQKYALWCSLAALKQKTDHDRAITSIVAIINDALKNSEVKAFNDLAFPDNALPQADPAVQIKIFLKYLCAHLDKDLIVFFDEADSLTEMPLITFLAQIRDGYIARDFSVNTKFPSSMALVGMRDIRDYVIHVHPDAASTGLTSPFNIKKEALTLANFTQGEIETLYKQHTEASGQIFEPDAIERAWYWTEGQPCLVNALAYEVICKILTKDYQIPVTAMLIDQAAETIIKRRDTHIDSLLEHLKEARVARVMDSIFASTVSYVSSTDDDRQYCIDLGLVVSNEQNELRPSNAIYREVIVRVITDEIQHVLNKTIPDFPWTNGQVILMTELLKEFQKYWRKGSLSFPKRKRNFIASHYDEALYSFILESFLQRLVNGQAVVLRQFAEGRGAVDIGISYNKREYIVEVEIKSNKSLNDSLTQLAKYLDANGEQEGWLVIFDRNINRSWDKKITWNTVEFQGKSIHIVGC